MPVITGGSLSITVTVKEHVALFPEESVAVAVTVVTPTGKKLPEAGTEATVTFEQLSVAVGVKVTTAPQTPRSLNLLMFAGQVITGGCVSLTVTLNVQVAKPPPFRAVAVTVVTPTGKVNGEVITVVPIR
jgi:hypothetical protein